MVTKKARSDDFYEGLAEMMMLEVLSDNGEPSNDHEGKPLRNYKEYMSRHVKKIANALKELHSNHFEFFTLQELVAMSEGLDEVPTECLKELDKVMDNFFNDEEHSILRPRSV